MFLHPAGLETETGATRAPVALETWVAIIWRW